MNSFFHLVVVVVVVLCCCVVVLLCCCVVVVVLLLCCCVVVLLCCCVVCVCAVREVGASARNNLAEGWGKCKGVLLYQLIWYNHARAGVLGVVMSRGKLYLGVT